MRMLQTTIVAGLALLLIAGGWRIGRSRLGARRESLEAGSMAFMNRMQASREAALDPAVQLAKRQLAERERAQAQEFESALGGPGGRALKDPALSLEGMIREWTQSVAPSGSIVVAQVDRFIEFSLLVELPRPASTEEIAEWSRSILSRLAPYLHWIRFVREGVLLAALDRRDVEALAAVGGGVPTQAIVDRFKNQERLIAEAALPPNESEKPEAASRLRAEGDGGDAVLDPEAVRLFNEFAHRFETNLVELLEIQDEFRLMRNVDEIITRVSLRARSERLTRDLRIVEARRLLLINPALEWEHTTPGSVDPSSRRAAAQRIAAQYKASVEGERLFDALKAQGDSVEKYVSLLLKAWGVWTVEKEGFYWVRFSDAALGREHDAARDAVTKREKDAVKAYHDWTEKAWGGIYARPEPSRDPKTRPKALPKRS